jgi:acetyl esterase/lipase
MTAGLTDAVGIDVHRGVPFASRTDETLLLDLYRPATASAESPRKSAEPAARRAAVVLVPGAQWRTSDRGELARYALDLAERGYVCAVPSYRGSDVAAFPAQICDLKAAVRWLRAHAADLGVAPGRIGAFGHDAGAHLAVLAALTADDEAFAPQPEVVVGVTERVAIDVSDSLAAVVGVAGTYALEHQPETDALVAFLGGDRESAPTAWEQASPSTYLRERGGGESGRTGVPPILLLHGEDDDVVPAMASEFFHDRLAENNIPAECVVATGAGHDVHRTQRSFTLGWIEGFFDKHLR